MWHASASNGLSDIETHIENAPCNRPLNIGGSQMGKMTFHFFSKILCALFFTFYGWQWKPKIKKVNSVLNEYPAPRLNTAVFGPSKKRMCTSGLCLSAIAH
jgi:hypothetical protein